MKRKSRTQCVRETFQRLPDTKCNLKFFDMTQRVPGRARSKADVFLKLAAGSEPGCKVRGWDGGGAGPPSGLLSLLWINSPVTISIVMGILFAPLVMTRDTIFHLEGAYSSPPETSSSMKVTRQSAKSRTHSQLKLVNEKVCFGER